MPELIPLPAFNDNYIWVLTEQHNPYCLVVDPGDAEAVIPFLQQQQKIPAAILITHHHADHTGGIRQLKQHYPACRIIGPAAEESRIQGLEQLVSGGDLLSVPELNWQCQVFDLPGHTAGHIGFYSAPVLFCGDTLFSVGCGRLFEGTAEQLYQSLQSLATLPDDTLICCTHEYTLANIAFALSVEPENVDLQLYLNLCQQKRHLSEPTLPALMATEKKLNPFLRCENSKLQRKFNQNSALALFTYLRRAKDQFKS